MWGRAQGVMASMVGHLEFKKVCDLDEDRAKAAVSKFGFQDYTKDWHELINDPDVEYISICLPPNLNYDIVMEAAKLGKPIWTEKPLDWKLDRAVEMVEMCAKYNTPIAVGQQYRYTDTAMNIKKLIDEGAIGKPFLGNLEHVFKSDSVYTDYVARVDRYLSSGMNIHYYDLFRYYLNDDADQVYAYLGQAEYLAKEEHKEPGKSTGDTICVAMVSFKKGAVVQFYCSEDIKGGDVKWAQRYHIAGSEGTIFVDAKEKSPVQIYRDATGKREPVNVKASTAIDSGKASGPNSVLLLEYLEAIKEGRPSPTCGAEHLKALAIAEATYKSAQTGCPVKVDELLSGV